MSCLKIIEEYIMRFYNGLTNGESWRLPVEGQVGSKDIYCGVLVLYSGSDTVHIVIVTVRGLYSSHRQKQSPRAYKN